MGRNISAGISPVTTGSFSFSTSTITVATPDTDIILAPTGTGTVQLEPGYINKSGIGANSILPKEYIDNNISPGLLYISLE
jgi:hypothetical protein